MNLNFTKKRIRNIVIISIITIIFIGIMTFIWHAICSYRFNIYANWKIILPRPEKINVVFEFELRKGEVFAIWDYDKISNVVESMKFEKIDKNNEEKITTILEKYYNRLDEEEREQFDEKTSIEYLKSQDNYYMYKGDEHRYLLLIACPDNKLYSLFARH